MKQLNTTLEEKLQEKLEENKDLLIGCTLTARERKRIKFYKMGAHYHQHFIGWGMKNIYYTALGKEEIFSVPRNPKKWQLEDKIESFPSFKEEYSSWVEEQPLQNYNDKHGT